MYLYGRKKTEQITMWSTAKNKVEHKIYFEQKYDPTDEEMEKLKNNWKAYWRDKKLILEKNDIHKEEEKIANKENKIKDYTEQLNSGVTHDELATITKELLNIIST